jgi:hypothetical protein
VKRELPMHKGRRVTDAQIRVLQAHVTLRELANAMGISFGYAMKLRNGWVRHKTRSP